MCEVPPSGRAGHAAAGATPSPEGANSQQAASVPPKMALAAAGTTQLYKLTDAEIRAVVNEFTVDDPPPYGLTDTERAEVELELATTRKHLAELQHIEPIPGNEGRREWSIAVARRQVRELERMLAA